MEFRALYNQHSKINHSCEPNVMLKHIENSAKIAIIATRKIQIDEEIGFDYTAGRGNVSKISDADERRKILKGLGFKNVQKCLLRSSKFIIKIRFEQRS